MRGTETTSRYWFYLAQIVILAIVYFGTAKLGLSLASLKGIVTLVWPPTGLALAVLLLFGYRLWPGIALGALWVNISAGASVAAVGIATGNVLEAVVGVYLLRRIGFHNSLERLRDVLGLVGLAALVSTMVSATIGAASLNLEGIIHWADYGSAWWVWWLGDLLGVLIVAPALLTWGTGSQSARQLPGLLEALALFVSLILVSQIVFSGWLASYITTTAPLSFTLFPFLVWAALRFGQRGAVTTTLFGTGIAVWGTAHGFGPFVLENVHLSLVFLGSFMGAAAVTAMILAAVLSESRRAQAARRNQEERYRIITELMSDYAVSVRVEPDGRLTQEWNTVGSFRRITGYTPEELGDTSKVYHPEDRELARCDLKAVLAGQPSSKERRIITKSGELRWMRIHYLPVWDPQETRVVRFYAVVKDITEHKQAEVSLRESEARYRGLFDDAPISLWEEDFSAVKTYIDELRSQGVTDFSLYFESHPEAVTHCLAAIKVIDVNKYTLDLYEAGSKEEFFKGLAQFFGPTSYDIFKEELTAIAQGKTRIELENVNYTLPGNAKEIVFTWFVCPGYEDTFSKVIVSVIDITERKRLEEQLRQAQKMEAIGQLAGGVAHDFNNILTVIKGYAELLLQNLEVHNPLSSDIGQIQKSAERATTLTRQLLAFARRQIIEPRILNLNDLVLNVEKMLNRLIGEDIKLVTVLAPDLALIKADAGQIEQVIINLAVNARDAMPQGGKLTIETKNVYLDQTYIRQRLGVKMGFYVLLTMSDTGVGMTEEVKARLFEPFFTTKEVGQGTGLGLATCFGIINQSGGHMEVYSQAGQGATFKVYLPQAEVAALKVNPDSQTVIPAGRGSETILLVEDEDPVRTLVRRVLFDEGYVVLEASQGEEAIRVAQRYQGSIDLLVTDVVMPGGMSGLQLAERLLRRRRDMKVLYISGYTDDAIVRHGVIEADIAFLQKPFTPNRLASKIREVLDMPQKIEQ